MNISGRTIIQILTMLHLLAVSWNVAADENDAAAVSPTVHASASEKSEEAAGDIKAADVQNVGIMSILVLAMAWLSWPLAGGVLMLAAVNSRKRPAPQETRAWRWPW